MTSPWLWVLGLVGWLVGGAVLVQAQQSPAPEPVGSFVALGAQVVGPGNSPTLYSTTDVSGQDQVRWTAYLQSRLGGPYEAQGEITLPSGQTWVTGSVKAAPNTEMNWKVNDSWVSAEPQAGTVVQAVRWNKKPQMLQASGAGAGSGTVVREIRAAAGVRIAHVMPYKDKLFSIENRPPLDRAVLNCYLASTGALCPGFEAGPLWFKGGGGVSFVGPANPAVQEDLVRSWRQMGVVNYDTGELFVAQIGLKDNANPAFSENYKTFVLCVDLNSLSSCGKWDMLFTNYEYSTIDLYIHGLVGDEYYFTRNFTLFCFNIRSKSACGSWIDYENALYGVQALVVNKKLFFWGNDYSLVSCFDPAIKNLCAVSPVVYGGTMYTNLRMLMPYKSFDGGDLCLGGFYDLKCYNFNGNIVPYSESYKSFFALFQNDYYYRAASAWWILSSQELRALVGQRIFIGNSGQTHDGDAAELYFGDPSIKCFDFSSDAGCGEIPLNNNITYKIYNDLVHTDCVISLGYGTYKYQVGGGGTQTSTTQTSVVTIFDGNTLGDCKALPGGGAKAKELKVDPGQSYQCQQSKAKVSGWREVRISQNMPWGGSGVESVTVTLKDKNGQVLPSQYNPVRPWTAGQYALKIDDIPYGLYPVLTVAVEVKAAAGATLGADAAWGVDVTWDGDPEQVCVETKMPASPDCQMKALLEEKTRTVDSAAGAWQETLNASAVLSQAGLSSGYAAYASATTARLNLQEFGAADPKTQIVQGRWSLQKFTGDVWSFQVTGEGQIDGSSHDSAEANTLAADVRPMYTGQAASAGAQAVKELKWESLTAQEQKRLNQNRSGVEDAKGPERLAYLRGVDGVFRSRSGSRLGPVINSAPVVLPVVPLAGLPEQGYPGYQAYRLRTPRAYPLAVWGGNDGAVHAYEVKPTGLKEAWSFVPTVMLGKAAQWSDADLQGIRANPYFVDNVPMVGHAKVGTLGWRAVLVQTYGRGARAITALDVTETDLSRGNGVLFEYTNESDPQLQDLGYIISQPGQSEVSMSSPQVVQLGESRRSAVLVGNGVDSNEGGVHSGTGRAVLYAFYLDATGEQRWQRWAVDELWSGVAQAPEVKVNNGLSTPTPVDVDGDGIVDVVYAGDIQGNLWRFDVRNPEAATVTRLFKTGVNQPITQAPFALGNRLASGCGVTVEGKSPSGAAARCWQVVFSTGAAISPLQGSVNVSTQSVYSVLDKGTGSTVAMGDLVSLGWASNQVVQGVEYRALGATTVDYASGAQGWKIDLQDYEHGVGAPKRQPTGLLMFSSIRPVTPGAAINVCIGPRSWLNEVDPLTGVTTQVLFDLNGDTHMDDQDYLAVGEGQKRAPQGMSVSGAQFGPPTILLPAQTAAQQMSLLLPSLGQDTRQENSWSGAGAVAPSSESVGVQDPGGKSRALIHANRARLGRMTWRELF